MSYRRVIITAISQRQTARGDPYLLVRFGSGGEPRDQDEYATCWVDLREALWPELHAACDSKEPIVLDICAAAKVGPGGRPYLNILGREHPGQGSLFGVE